MKPAGQAPLCAVEVRAAQQDINILRISHGRFIDFAHPGGDGIAADDGVRNRRLLQGLGGAAQASRTFSTAVTILSQARALMTCVFMIAPGIGVRHYPRRDSNSRPAD